MITTKHGIKFCLSPKNNKLNRNPKVRKWLLECEKIIANELDKLDLDEFQARWFISDTARKMGI